MKTNILNSLRGFTSISVLLVMVCFAASVGVADPVKSTKPKTKASKKEKSQKQIADPAADLAADPKISDLDAKLEMKGEPDSLSDEGNLLYMKGRQRVLDGNLEEAVPFLEKAMKTDPENPFLNHQLSEIYLRLNQFDKAEAAGKIAVQKEPKNLEYLATLGGIYATTKRYDESKKQYGAIMELDPTNQRAPLLLGMLEAESGDLEAGVKVLTKATDDNAENYMAFFYRAKVYLEMEQISKAKADLDKCLTLRPAFIEAGTALGLLQERMGETEEAIKTYSRIQGNGRFKKRLAQLYLQKNEFEKALNELVEYEEVEPDDYTARVKIGLIYFELKQYDKALGRFQAILKEQPEADNVRFYTGAVYEELKNFDSAVAEFKKVSKDSTFFKEAMLHIGFIYKEREKLQEGLDFSKKLVKQAPDIVEFYDMYASFFEAKREYAKALGVIADGLGRYPGDEKLLYFQGALNDKLGERRKAIDNMKKILTANPNNAHALNFLGYTYAELGENLDEAEKNIRRALELRPTDGYIEDSLGWVLFKRGKTDEALAHLEKASLLQPEEAVILEHMGDIQSEKKEFGKASELYKKAAGFVSKKDKDQAKKIENKIAAAGRGQKNPETATK